MARHSGIERSVTELFRREEVIGRGNFGVVYKARNLVTGKPVAIKALDLDTEHDEVKDVQHEVALLAQLTEGENNNITKYYGSYLVGSKLWIIMDLCSGGSVRTLLKAGPLEEKYISLITRETAVALNQIHKHGIIHRDIKAANLLITNEGKLSLCDFGVAVDASFTQNKRSTIVGTPYWMAPEVITEGKSYTSKADIWSLGVTLYEMATGNPPYSEFEAMRALMMISKGRPPRLEGAKYSAALKDIIACSLDEVPEERPSAEELIKHKFLKQYARTPTSALRDLLHRYSKWEEQQKAPRNSLLMYNAEQFEKIDNGDEIQRAEPLDDSVWDFEEVTRSEKHMQPAVPQEAITSDELADAPQSLRELFVNNDEAQDLTGDSRVHLPLQPIPSLSAPGTIPTLETISIPAPGTIPAPGIISAPGAISAPGTISAPGAILVPGMTPASEVEQSESEEPVRFGKTPKLPPIDVGRSLIGASPMSAITTTNTEMEFRSPLRYDSDDDRSSGFGHSRNTSVASSAVQGRLRSDSIGLELLPSGISPNASVGINRLRSASIVRPTPLRAATTLAHSVVPALNQSPENSPGHGNNAHSPGFFSAVGVVTQQQDLDDTESDYVSKNELPRFPHTQPLGQNNSGRPPFVPGRKSTPPPPITIPSFGQDSPSSRRHLQPSQRSKSAAKLVMAPTPLFAGGRSAGNTLSAYTMSPGSNYMSPITQQSSLQQQLQQASQQATQQQPPQQPPLQQAQQAQAQQLQQPLQTPLQTPQLPSSALIAPGVRFPSMPALNLSMMLDSTPKEEFELQFRHLLGTLDQAFTCMSAALSAAPGEQST